MLQNATAYPIARARLVTGAGRGARAGEGVPHPRDGLGDFHTIIVTLFAPALKEGHPYRP